MNVLEQLSVRERQGPLQQQYKVTPDKALITDRARTVGGTETDPFHGHVVIGDDAHGVVLPFGIHRAVGGYHDMPNPGDLLCAAIASCLDSTMRIIAEHLGVQITKLEVDVTANVDVRGTLLVERSVPVGFQSMQCNVNLEAAEGTPPALVQKLVAMSEHSCVNVQTLLGGIAVETNVVESPLG